MQSASADSGYFQQSPVLKNQLHDDPSLRRILRLFLPSDILCQAEPELRDFGDRVLSQDIFDSVTDAERSVPYLRGNGRDVFGRPRSDSLVVAEGWKKLQSIGIEYGVSAYNYDQDRDQYNRVLQMLRLLLWSASSANTTCPVAMQDGATRLLQRQLAKLDLDPTHRGIFQNAYNHLVSRVPGYAWTSGQWMTERAGGSDVSQTETLATHAPFPKGIDPPLADACEGTCLGPWSISGAKWFSSATDSSMVILLAKTSPDKGVSAFFAPMRKHNPCSMSPTGTRGGTEMNGVRIVRLKDKMGTKSLPTAELELRNMRGWLIGDEGRGIQEIATILNITRVHSSISALSYLGRGIAVAKAYTLVREIGATRGTRISLCKSPLHMRTLANMTIEYHAMMLLTFYTVYLLGLDEKPFAAQTPLTTKAMKAITPPAQHVAPLLRILSSLHKAYVCKKSIPLMYGCMESLGGIGYLNNTESEHLNLSRIFRDLCVLATWEGTTDVLSTDMLRAMKHPREGKSSLDALDWFFGASKPELRALQAWTELRARLTEQTQDHLTAEARDICFALAEVLMASLLEVDVAFEGDDTARVVRDRFLWKRRFIDAGVETLRTARKLTLEVDVAIVFGARGLAGTKPGPRL